MRSSVFRRQPSSTEETGTSTEQAGDGLVDVLERSHQVVRDRFAAAAASGASQDAVDAHDALVAALAGHLAVSTTVLLPAARRHVSDQGHAVTRLRHQARALSRRLQLLQGRLHGDHTAGPGSIGELRSDLEERFSRWFAEESALAGRLGEVLSPEHGQRLAALWVSTAKHAPTRPHPYTTHNRLLGSLMLRGDRLWDDALDLMDNRVVPTERPRRLAPPLTAWGRYLVGNPDFPQQDGDDRRR